MKTVRRLVFGTVLRHILLVAVAFAALFFFIDFVDELQDVGRNGYKLYHAIETCLLLQGPHLYDLFPIALLIGSILALARLAQTSEFTILRTGGLGPGRALGLMISMGLLAAITMVFIGNWYVPWSERQLTLHRSQFSQKQGINLGQGGTWLRERRTQITGDTHLITVNVGQAFKQDHFGNVRIFEFDTNGQLQRRIEAKEAKITPQTNSYTGQGSVWELKGVQETTWIRHDMPIDDAVRKGLQVVKKSDVPVMTWQSSLTPVVVSASVLPPETMSTVALWQYTQHLTTNAQQAQRYEIEFWKKTFYPLVCMVMVALSLPFAYLHARAGSMSLKIFGGIMLGISFVLANHISGHLGLLHQWQPWLAAAAPSVFYLLLSMSAFIWLVRYR